MIDDQVAALSCNTEQIRRLSFVIRFVVLDVNLEHLHILHDRTIIVRRRTIQLIRVQVGQLNVGLQHRHRIQYSGNVCQEVLVAHVRAVRVDSRDVLEQIGAVCIGYVPVRIRSRLYVGAQRRVHTLRRNEQLSVEQLLHGRVVVYSLLQRCRVNLLIGKNYTCLEVQRGIYNASIGVSEHARLE